MRIAACIVLFAAGCGHSSNDLWGSIDESFPLEFDRVDILKQDQALRIEYLKDVPGGTNWVAKLVLDTTNLTIGDNSDVQGSLFLERVTLTRVSNTGGQFPKVNGGQLHFDNYKLADGGRMAGDFTALFENGRNMFGNFDGRVKEVSTQ